MRFSKKYNIELREKVYNDAIRAEKYKVYKLTDDDSIVVTDDCVSKIDAFGTTPQ